jgi:hypothetical protein
VQVLFTIAQLIFIIRGSCDSAKWKAASVVAQVELLRVASS